jgi:hypothetical protein
MEWVIAFTVGIVVYVFVVRRRGRDALADAVAHGGARGARRATHGYFRQEQEQLPVDGVVGSDTGEALAIWSS